MRGQLKTYHDAKPAKRQHTSPCSDCPFARTALRGWLGNMSPAQWIQIAHGDGIIECHTVSNQQCAGAAIYRANVCKDPRNREALRLPANKTRVFGQITEFLQHHAK